MRFLFDASAFESAEERAASDGCDRRWQRGYTRSRRWSNCITRPALANERVQTNAAGQVVLSLSST